MTTKKSVWETLSKIDVSEHTREKNGLTYLSWAWAWGSIKNNYPTATFEKHTDASGVPYFMDGNGYAYVKVTVTVEGESATELFPVLDYRNKSIQDPTSFDVNNALQRALAKAIAYHGLGHYIYAGEDLPQDKPAEQSKPRQAPAREAKAPDEEQATAPAEGLSDEEYEAIHGTPDVVSSDGTATKTQGWPEVAEAIIRLLPIHQTEEELVSMWVANKSLLTQLQDKSPELYDEVVGSFKARKAELKKG